MPFFFLLLFDTTGAHIWWHKHPRVEDCDRVHWAGAYGWSPETGSAQGLRKHSATGTISPIPASSDPSTAKNEMVCGSVKYPGDGQAPGPWSYVRYYSWVHVDDDGSPKVITEQSLCTASPWDHGASVRCGDLEESSLMELRAKAVDHTCAVTEYWLVLTEWSRSCRMDPERDPGVCADKSMTRVYARDESKPHGGPCPTAEKHQIDVRLP